MDPLLVAITLRIELEEALVVVVVPGQGDVDARVGEHLPERLDELLRIVLAPRPARVVEEGELAQVVVASKIGAQPAKLLGVGVDVDVRVEGNQVPAAEVERVVRLPRSSGPLAEVGDVACRAGRAVIVISGDGVGAIAKAAPARVVAASELFGASRLIRVVPEGEDGSGIDPLDEIRRLLIAARGAGGDVAGSDDSGRGLIGVDAFGPVSAVVSRPRIAAIAATATMTAAIKASRASVVFMTIAITPAAPPSTRAAPDACPGVSMRRSSPPLRSPIPTGTRKPFSSE